MTPPNTHSHGGKQPIWQLPGMAALMLLTLCGFGGFSALISVVPLYAVRGGATEAGAGAITFLLLGATVGTQPFVPRLLARFGHGVMLTVAMVLLGVPSLALWLSSDLVPVLGVSVLRGMGFGILTVTGSAVVADLCPTSRRGEGVGAYGLSIAIPNLLLLPASVVIAENLGFGASFVVGAIPLLGIPAAFVLGRAMRGLAPHADTGPAPVPGDRGRAIRRLAVPSAVLLAITLTGGALMTFVPQITGSAWWAMVALFVFGATGAFSRWWIGKVADRRGIGMMMFWLLLVGGVGMIGVSLAVHQAVMWVLLVAVAVVGVAYGALQSLTLLSAFSQVDRRHYGTASAVWNIGFDSGTAIGSMVLGAVAGLSSFTVGMGVLALLVFAALPAARVLAGRPSAD